MDEALEIEVVPVGETMLLEEEGVGEAVTVGSELVVVATVIVEEKSVGVGSMLVELEDVEFDLVW